MAITGTNDGFYLETKNTSYIFGIYGGFPVHLYYGAKIRQYNLSYLMDRQIYGFEPYSKTDGVGVLHGSLLLEYSGGNTGDYRTCGINIKDGKGRIGCRLKYSGFQIEKGAPKLDGLPYCRAFGKCETLIINLCDNEKNLAVKLYYTVFEDYDVIARHTEIVNTGTEPLTINKAASMVLDFNPQAFDLVELAGTLNYEHIVQRSPLVKGIRAMGSCTGFTSHFTNPFFCLCDKNADEKTGGAYAFNLLYSGSFLNEIQIDNLSKTRIVSGIHPESFEWRLNPSKKFVTPQAVLTFSPDGIGGISRNFHDFIRTSILSERFAFSPRGIIANTWEAYRFEVSEDKFLAFADKAKQLNIDTVVLDDGWFRENDTENLGDWKLDAKRFPNGLKWLSDRIHAKNLKFGLWFEPEMISENSELFKNHPDWIIQNGNEPYLSRSQYMLDFSSDNVVECIFNKINGILHETEIDYVKWDANRYLSETGSRLTEVQGEVMHRRTLGLYTLLERLTSEHPHILFESCAGGGGRFDLGMLFYTPQIWLSDNTNPLNRKDMQWGASLAYPPSAIGCHVTDGKWLDGFNTDIEFRYMVSSFGAFGYEFDLFTLGSNDCQKVVEFNKNQKRIEDLILKGDLYRLADGPYYQAYMQVSKDKTKALLTFLLIRARMGMEFVPLKLYGLDRNIVYKNYLNNLRIPGDVLMKAGILIGDLNCPHDTNKGHEVFLNKVKQSAGGVQILFEKI